MTTEPAQGPADPLSVIGEMLGILRSDPKVAAALDRHEAQLDRVVPYVCGWGTCVADYDPVEKRILGGYGDPLCGCENLPGWRSRHPEGRPKPGVAVKARGRHGSRVQRSRRRRAGWKEWSDEHRRNQ